MFSSRRLSAQETVSANMRQERVQCTAEGERGRLWMQQTGGQILPCSALSGTYCREPRPFGIRKPLFSRAFDRGTALAGHWP
jgi:hypothetical protein